MTKAELLEELESLSLAVREGKLSDRQIEKVSAGIQELRLGIAPEGALNPSRLLELKGLGKELWQDIDVDEYIRSLRE